MSTVGGAATSALRLIARAGRPAVGAWAAPTIDEGIREAAVAPLGETAAVGATTVARPPEVRPQSRRDATAGTAAPPTASLHPTRATERPPGTADPGPSPEAGVERRPSPSPTPTSVTVDAPAGAPAGAPADGPTGWPLLARRPRVVASVPQRPGAEQGLRPAAMVDAWDPARPPRPGTGARRPEAVLSAPNTAPGPPSDGAAVPVTAAPQAHALHAPARVATAVTAAPPPTTVPAVSAPAPQPTVALPPSVVIDEIRIVTPPSAPPPPDLLASLSGLRGGPARRRTGGRWQA